MSFTSSFSVADIIEIGSIIALLIAIYFKNEKKSDDRQSQTDTKVTVIQEKLLVDERLVKNESDVNALKTQLNNMNQDCVACKSDLSKRINDVELRASDRFNELTTRFNSLEQSIRQDIRDLGQNIINIIQTK